MVGVFKASYAVTDTNVVPLVRPGAAFVDLLTEVLCNGTRAACAAAPSCPSNGDVPNTKQGCVRTAGPPSGSFQPPARTRR
jgi:hypothetical protein